MLRMVLFAGVSALMFVATNAEAVIFNYAGGYVLEHTITTAGVYAFSVAGAQGGGSSGGKGAVASGKVFLPFGDVVSIVIGGHGRGGSDTGGGGGGTFLFSDTILIVAGGGGGAGLYGGGRPGSADATGTDGRDDGAYDARGGDGGFGGRGGGAGADFTGGEPILGGGTAGHGGGGGGGYAGSGGSAYPAEGGLGPGTFQGGSSAFYFANGGFGGGGGASLYGGGGGGGGFSGGGGGSGAGGGGGGSILWVNVIDGVLSGGVNEGDGFASLDLIHGGGGVPEPTAWGLLTGGFGIIGTAMRRRKTRLA